MLMSGFLKPARFSPGFRVLTVFVCSFFLYEIIAADILHLKSAEALAQVNMPSNLVMPSASFSPASLKAIHIDPQAPFQIDFIVDSADQAKVSQREVNKLVQYFLASMTTPEQDMWVNLSPYESKRIIAEQFGATSAGRELLSQDQLLKQLAASLTYPESETGKAFWSRVYEKAIAIYGTTAVPIDTFQRVWIMPEKAVVYEYNGTAFITESHLKVLLEDDYKALKNAQTKDGSRTLSDREAEKVNNFSAAITREIVLPEIEKEINEGKNFAALRQIFNAIILATWFKKKLKQHILAQVYVDRKKVKGIEDNSERTAEKIYQQYVQVLKEGVYNYVRGDYDAPSQTVISRQYFSGGFSIGNTNEWMDIRPISNLLISSRDFLRQLGRKLLFARIQLRPLGVGGALQLAVPVKVITKDKDPSAFNNWVTKISTVFVGNTVAPVASSSVGGAPSHATQLQDNRNVGSVFTARVTVVGDAELGKFFITKFQKAIANNPSSPVLAFIRGPARVMKDDEMLKKAGGIDQAPVYIVEDGKIKAINAKGRICTEVSSSAVLKGGLVFVVVPDEQVRYFDAAAVEKKTGASREAQLAGYLSDKAVAAAGGSDKKKETANDGGIDMQVEESLDVRGEDRTDWGAALMPASLLQDLDGMNFEILQLTPITNPGLFMPDFVRENAIEPQQLISLKTP